MKLLLVEDEERMARMLARGLAEEGHAVDVCASGLAARDRGLANGYDVALLDWSLPDLDGVSVLREWRTRGLRTPVLGTAADGTVKVAVTEADAVARLSVHDDGPGIPASERERVFEPFQRGERGGDGTGLGLAIVRTIARGHGGRAYVADSGPGATVVIELPAARGAVAQPSRLTSM